MRWKAFTTLIVVAMTLQVAVMQAPVSAQILPPSRNSFSLGIATFNPSVYTLGMSWPIAPAWDIILSYSWQTIGGATGSLTGIGGRYFFPLSGSTMTPYVGGGFASVGTSVGGFPSVNASGLFLTAGASMPLAQKITGYANISMFSAGGTTNNVVDLGAQFRVAQTFSAQVGYISFSGSAAPYIGVTLHLR